VKTVILVRHADIDPPPEPTPTGWPLNAAGRARAQVLLHVVGSAGVTAVFASPAARTQQTVGPVVTDLGVELQIPASPELIPEILSDGAGNVVLVAGHSNTVPEIAAALGAPFPGPLITGHDDLLVVTVLGPGQARVVRLKYGQPTP
jgi:phosphohistidine phosphatase SixA